MELSSEFNINSISSVKWQLQIRHVISKLALYFHSIKSRKLRKFTSQRRSWLWHQRQSYTIWETLCSLYATACHLDEL